ncbi:hypothetical protein KBB96_07860 [Luteolibacter ambystomatis]|uniref:Uncharacterized protein n=1 Tax=Luteolibacter ambystomatis TaxID=2824561 RepID=A0A975PGZ2_9BACT|nr:hypothetical protein [Luteolibacter ambystomatis]QUE52797.1 hypothetical protein KBB96_07860 [Luteolibacter ambystomatis]
MNPKILPVVFSGSLGLAAPLFAQESVPIEGHVVILVEKQPLEGVVVKRTAVHDQGDHTVIMQKIAPPALPEEQPALLRGAVQSFQQTGGEQRVYKALGLTAIIYDHQKTYLEWAVGEQRFAAWSNVDFSLLANVAHIPVGEELYSFLMVPANVDTAKLASLYQTRGQTYQAPQVPAFPSTLPSLIVTRGDASNAAALAPVQALLQHYRDNEAVLKAAYAQRTADAAAQKAYDEAHPKQPKDTTVQFWKRQAPATQTNSEEGAP